MKCNIIHNRVVNLSQNTVQVKNSLTHASCRNFRNYLSAHSMFDYPKMPRVSKKANLVEELDVVVESGT